MWDLIVRQELERQEMQYVCHYGRSRVERQRKEAFQHAKNEDTMLILGFMTLYTGKYDN